MSEPIKAQLWVISGRDDNAAVFCDDRGGQFFTSERLALETMKLHGMTQCVVRLTELDDDLAQMGDLYHEFRNT